MKKYRIGVICAAPSAQMSGQYDALADMDDYEFILLFKYPQSSNAAWSKVEPKYVKWEVLPPKPSWVPAKFGQFFNGDIRSILDKYDFDAMILHGIYDSTSILQAQRWCCRKSRPYLIRTDGNLKDELCYSRTKKMLHRLMVGSKVKNAAAFLTIGEANCDYYKHFGAREGRFFMAPWEIDYDVIENSYQASLASRDEIRKRLGVDAETLFICCISRMVMRKGYATVIPAVAGLKNRGYKIHLLLAGSGPDEATVRKLAADYGVEAAFPGNLDRQLVAEAMVASDVFVQVSTHEPWGLVINEAALCGLPIITTDCVGAAGDLISQGENGWTIPVNDISALERHLAALAEDVKLRTNMGLASRRILLKWREKFPAKYGYKKALDFALGDKRDATE